VAAFIWTILGLATCWSVAALFFDVRISWLRLPLAVIYGSGIFAGWIFLRRGWKMAVTGAGFLIVLTW
jgi:hypothetical protein